MLAQQMESKRPDPSSVFISRFGTEIGYPQIKLDSDFKPKIPLKDISVLTAKIDELTSALPEYESEIKRFQKLSVKDREDFIRRNRIVEIPRGEVRDPKTKKLYRQARQFIQDNFDDHYRRDLSYNFSMKTLIVNKIKELTEHRDRLQYEEDVASGKIIESPDRIITRTIMKCLCDEISREELFRICDEQTALKNSVKRSF